MNKYLLLLTLDSRYKYVIRILPLFHWRDLSQRRQYDSLFGLWIDPSLLVVQTQCVFRNTRAVLTD